jgi:hypothetical protein
MSNVECLKSGDTATPYTLHSTLYTLHPYTIHHSLTYLRLKVGFEGDYSGYMKKKLYLCTRIRILIRDLYKIVSTKP